MQSDKHIQKYKEIQVVWELSNIQPEAANQPILHRSSAHNSAIQDFYSFPERKWWDSYIMGIFHFRCSSYSSLDSCMHIQYRWRHLVAVWWTNWSHVTIPYFEQVLWATFNLPLPNNSLNKFNLRLLIFFWCLPFRGLMHYFPSLRKSPSIICFLVTRLSLWCWKLASFNFGSNYFSYQYVPR